MEKKKLLIVCDWYEPGFKAGGPIQSIKNIVTALQDQLDIYIYTSDRDLGDAAPYKNITTDSWQVLVNGLKVWYASPTKASAAHFRTVLQGIAPGIVYFNSMFSTKYTIAPLRVLVKDRFNGKIVLAPRGMLHKGGLQKKTFKKSIFLAFFKLIGWHKKIIFHATDEQEKEDIKKFFSGALAIEVAGNIPHYNERPWKERNKTQQVLNCVYISRIHPKKNLAFFLEVLKNANANLSVHFDVYGEEDDKEYASKCKQVSSGLRQGIQTRFLGPLTHDKVIQTLEQYHLFVLPTLGENFAHAVYEALSAGCPVLISDQTPWHNLAQQKTGFDYSLQESLKFKEAVEQMAALGQQEYNIWSKNAYQKAAEYYKQSDLVNTYLKLFS